MTLIEEVPAVTPLSLIRSFLLPRGDEAVRTVKEIRTRQRGRIRASADARWIPFDATEVIDARRSRFRWEATIGSVTVVDGFDDGHGILAMRDESIRGAEVDYGELQRYLAAIAFGCGPAFLNHPTLRCDSLDPLTLRLRDTSDTTGAFIDLHVGERGCPLLASAIRPRIAGRNVVPTPWEATGADFVERDAIRFARRLTAFWVPQHEQRFAYVEAELTSIDVI